jgi:hypothetical protein
VSISLGLKSPMRIYGGFVGTETLREQRNWSANTTRLTLLGNRPLFENFGNLGIVDHLAVLDGFTLSGVLGNAIANYSASPSIRNCTFENNEVAIFNSQDSNPQITNCVFRNHTNSFGGAIYNYASSPTIENCVFQNNRSLDRGAALLAVDYRLRVAGDAAPASGPAVTFSAGF